MSLEAAVPTTPVRLGTKRSRAASAADGLMNLAQLSASPRSGMVPCSPDALQDNFNGYDLSQATSFPTKEELIQELKKSPSTQSLAELAEISGATTQMSLPDRSSESPTKEVTADTKNATTSADDTTSQVPASRTATADSRDADQPAAKKAKLSVAVDSESLFASSIKLLTPRAGSSNESLIYYINCCLNIGDLKLLKKKQQEAQYYYECAQRTLGQVSQHVGTHAVAAESIAELTARVSQSFHELRLEMRGQEGESPAARYKSAKQAGEVASILASGFGF